MNTLYIIGNGFDLAHGMPTSYNDFREYLKNYEGDLTIQSMCYHYIKEHLDHSNNDIWNRFEYCLADINLPNFIQKYNTDGWDQKALKKYIPDITNALTDLLNIQDPLEHNLLMWISSISVPKKKLIKLTEQSFFLSFNYTLVLEELYQIDPNNILHIHGSRNTDKLIIGHNGKNFLEEYPDREGWCKILGIPDILNNLEYAYENYLKKTKKPVYEIINEHSNWFNNLSSINKIIIIGHSMNHIDMPYFDEIIESVSEKAIIELCYHDEESKTQLEANIRDVSFKDRLTLIHIDRYKI